MRLLFIGDIFAKPGRNIVIKKLPKLIDDWQLDFVVANGENSAHGFGMTHKIVNALFRVGVDVITSGNHAFDNEEITRWLADEPRVLRPYNWSTPDLMGRGIAHLNKRNQSLSIANLACRVFMKEPASDPFTACDEIIKNHPIGENKALFFDVHGEATSEKQALGHYVDGRASILVGTHVHIPTADARILEKGTAYQTDAGMSGVYNSVIGVNKEASINRIRGIEPRLRFVPQEGDATLCGVLVDIEDKTGLANRVAPIRIGGDLAEFIPDWAKKA
ncbi:MAG: TIGR00282 family metallophosphoesterase [Alphaproteobacteria bacterium]